MRRLISSLLLIFTASYCLSQEKTYSPDKKLLSDKEGKMGSLVIIPFEDKMYLSEADASIGKETGLGPGELRPKFKISLVESLEMNLRGDWSVLLINEETRLDQGLGLDYVYSSFDYRYQPVSVEVQMANDTSLKKKDLSKEKGKKNESGIKDGEIVTGSDNGAMYMAPLITRDSFMTFLDSSLGADYYLILTEFDIRHHISDPDRIATGGLMYRLKIHFACIDKIGKSLVAGAVTTDVSTNGGNIYEIIAEGIPVLSEKLSKLIYNKRMSLVRQ